MLTFKYPNPSNLEIRGLRTFTGMEGSGYNATLYADGKRVALLIDDASGGPLDVRSIGTAGDKVLADITALCLTLPHEKHFDDLPAMAVTRDLYLEELVNHAEMARKVERLRQKGVVFRLKSDNDGTFRSVNTLDIAKATAFLSKKFPNNYVLL